MFDYEKWIGEQSEEIKTGIEEHYNGLLNTVKATRQERDELSAQLKKSKSMDEVKEILVQLDGANKKASFMEQAITKGVKRPGALFSIANAENLYNDKGEPDWEKLHESVPELFGASVSSNDAGSGTNLKPQGDTNKTIRESLSKNGSIKIKT
jgi:hypothetical protein